MVRARLVVHRGDQRRRGHPEGADDHDGERDEFQRDVEGTAAKAFTEEYVAHRDGDEGIDENQRRLRRGERPYLESALHDHERAESHHGDRVELPRGEESTPPRDQHVGE